MAKKVLIVDDMLFMRAALKKILEGLDCEVVGEAENGEQGIEMYKRLKPDLTTMDITMPVMDGLQALESIKKHDSNAKVVMVSAMGQEKNVMTAIQLGAKNFIVNPFNVDKVKEIVTPILNG